MKNLYTIIYCFVCLLVVFPPTFAQKNNNKLVVKITNDDSTLQNLNAYLQIMEDTTGKLKFEDIRSVKFSSQFTPYQQFTKTHKLIKNKVYWAKITFENSSDRNHWVLSVGSGDYIEMYAPDKQARYKRKMNGQLIPASKREIRTNIVDGIYKFNLFLIPEKSTDIFLKLQGKIYSPKFKLKLINSSSYLKQEASLEKIQFLFQGALWVILIYNFILFLLVRDATYLYYSAYIFIYAFYYLVYYGFSSEWPNLQKYTNAVCIPLALVFYFQYVRLFVNTKKLTPNLDTTLRKWIKMKFIVVVCIIGSIIFTRQVSVAEILIIISVFFDIIIFLYSVYILFKTTSILARHIIIGSLVLMFGWGLSLASFVGLLKLDINENYFSQTGLVLELILFSVGLGYRERKNEQDKRLAEEANARIIEEQNALLERKVYKRTKEIRSQNEELTRKQNEIAQQNNQLAEQHELISTAHNLLSKAHKKIQSSINSGLRIQKAVLPVAERMQKALPNHFVFYRPRDVVSGDFYWFEEIGQKQFIVAADCTGHGISGAFMTMLCIQAFNTVIMQQRIDAPDQILNELNLMLPKILKTPKTSVRDGMDVAICVLDKTNQTIAYAGALSPLVIIQNNEMQFIKGDIYGINGHRKDDETSVQYTLHTFDIDQPTSIYMFSDGVQDQFGGPQGRKFSSKRLKKLLIKMAKLPIAEQKPSLDQAMDEWMGDSQDQIDDMLLIGLYIEA